jgi:DnaJ-class molecular chaperone
VSKTKAKDYYGLLGVPRDATRDLIQRAYRRLARQWRPTAAGAAEQFRTLQDAYETLTNPAARDRYDRALQPHDAAAVVPAWSPTGRGESWAAFAPTETGELLVSAAEAARGGTFPLDIPIRSACTACRGRDETWACGTCGGEGTVTVRLPAGLRLPAGTRDGTVFQIHMDTGVPISVFLTVHIVR